MYYETYSSGMLLSELEEAGNIEVYEAEKENMGNRHTDSIGEYKGDNLKYIPIGAKIEYSVLDAEEYAESVLANCGGDAEDFVGEETGKVLVVQYFIPSGNFEEHYVIDVPHTGNVKWWYCESFWATAINDESIDDKEFNTLEDAQEFYYGEEIPAQLREMLIAGRKVIGVSREGGEMEFYFADEFDREEYARDYYRSDLSGMIVLDSFEDAYYKLEHCSGHQAAGIKSAIEEIIDHNA